MGLGRDGRAAAARLDHAEGVGGAHRLELLHQLAQPEEPRELQRAGPRRAGAQRLEWERRREVEGEPSAQIAAGDRPDVGDELAVLVEVRRAEVEREIDPKEGVNAPVDGGVALGGERELERDGEAVVQHDRHEQVVPPPPPPVAPPSSRTHVHGAPLAPPPCASQRRPSRLHSSPFS